MLLGVYYWANKLHKQNKTQNVSPSQVINNLSKAMLQTFSHKPILKWNLLIKVFCWKHAVCLAPAKSVSCEVEPVSEQRVYWDKPTLWVHTDNISSSFEWESNQR